jgi:hypothetical protein
MAKTREYKKSLIQRFTRNEIMQLGMHRQVKHSFARRRKNSCHVNVPYTRTSFRFTPYSEYTIPGLHVNADYMIPHMRTLKFAKLFFQYYPTMYFAIKKLDLIFLTLASDPDEALLAAVTAKQMEQPFRG